MTLAIILLGLGLALIVAEVLFPSFGILSILAAAAIIGSVVSAFQVSETVGYRFLMLNLCLVPVSVLLGFKFFPQKSHREIDGGAGLVLRGRSGHGQARPRIAGRRGALSAPTAGPPEWARLEGRRVDVVTRGEWIEAGSEVRVVEVSGNRVVVTALGSAPEPDSAVDSSDAS